MPLKKTSGLKTSVTSEKQYQDLKQAKEALRESEDRFRKIVEQAPIAMAIVGLDGVIEFINHKAVTVFGYLPEDIPNMDRWWIQAYPDEAYRKDVVADWTKRIKTALTEGSEIVGNEYRVTCKDGAIKTMFISGVPVSDKVFVLFDDITERKQAEEALRLRESCLSAIIENQPGLLWLKDRAGKFLSVNTKFSNSCGLNDPELLVGKTDFDIWPHDLAAGYVADDNGVMQSGNPFMVEERISDKGDIRWFETFKAPIMDKQGVVIGTTGLSRDITERKQAEETLSRSEKRYRLLYEYAPIGILLVNRSGQILEVNSAAVKILGSPSPEATKEINILTFPLLIEAGISAAFRQCVEMGQVVFDEYRYVTKWGKSIYQELRFVPIFDDNDRVNLVHAIIEDITERKRMEEELQKAQKLESLGVLAGGIAHDFNNLLTGIYGYIDLARTASKDARAIEYLEATLSSMTRARALTLQLLTFAKGGSPVQKLTPLVPFIQETAQFALSGSNISCRFSLPENLLPCNIDKNQIGQVIDNIVINAQQAMPNGGAIEISAQNISFEDKGHVSLAMGDYVKVSIKDSGIGIPQDVMPRIFDPFYTTKTKGHGLGLATSYSIINRHGGFIDVESEPGKGSAFHVYLPASAKAVASEAIAIVKHAGNGAIIIMDDEEIIRTTVGDMLESLGYSVECKNDGKEAIDFYRKETGAGRRFAAMIFDLTIPGGMGGIEAVADVRKVNKEIPVFVASGYADNSAMKDPARYGFTASICKPFTIAELSEMLDRYLRV